MHNSSAQRKPHVALVSIAPQQDKGIDLERLKSAIKSKETSNSAPNQIEVYTTEIIELSKSREFIQYKRMLSVCQLEIEIGFREVKGVRMEYWLDSKGFYYRKILPDGEKDKPFYMSDFNGIAQAFYNFHDNPEVPIDSSRNLTNQLPKDVEPVKAFTNYVNSFISDLVAQYTP